MRGSTAGSLAGVALVSAPLAASPAVASPAVTLPTVASLAVTSPAVTLPTVAAAAHTAGAPDSPMADLRVVYGQPDIAGGGAGVTWHWTLANNGTGNAVSITATHRLSAGQQVVAVSAPCTAAGTDVTCRFDTLRPREQRAGWIRTTTPATGGMLRINAQVSWHENQNILPGVGDAPETASQGKSRAETGTEIPAP